MAGMPIEKQQVPEWARYSVWVLANLGFPAAVATFLLRRVTSTLDAINATLARQQALLDVLARNVERLAGR